MYKDSIGQEVQISDLIVWYDSKGTNSISEILEFKDGKFGNKNLPVIVDIWGESKLLYSWFVKIALQDKTKLDKDYNII